MKSRHAKRLSQKEVADMLGIAQSTYANWESDKTFPTFRHFGKLSDVFEISVSELVDPQWKVELKEEKVSDSFDGRTLIKGNARQLFEQFFESQVNYYRQLEEEIEQLRQDVKQLRKELKIKTEK